MPALFRTRPLPGTGGESGFDLSGETAPVLNERQAMAEILGATREIGQLSRAAVENSMSSAEDSSAQRARAAAVMQMQDNIRIAAESNGRNSRTTAERVDAVAGDIERDSAVLERTGSMMQETASAVAVSADLMLTFVEKIGELTRVLKTINDIALQTNLLALNAAIEAAHVGSGGEGFSVIAQEVRRLSNRTSEAADQIGDQFSRMSADAMQAGTAMQTGKLSIESSVQQNLLLQSSFARIRDAMQEVKGESAAVAAASDEQLAQGARVAEETRVIEGLAEKSTQEADTSAEMSMRMVSCTARLQKGLASVRSGGSGALTEERAVTQAFLGRLTEHAQPLLRAREMLRALCGKAGAVTVQGSVQLGEMELPALHFGTAKSSAALRWVDEVHQATQCVATIFVRDGERFVRIATNVKRPNGQRATGTVLNPKGLAAGRLRGGKSYEGAVYILGKPFLASYEPLLAADGELVGALYVGRAIG